MLAAWKRLNPQKVELYNERRRLGRRERECIDCGETFGYQHASAVRCPECRLERQLAGVRRRYYGAKSRGGWRSAKQTPKRSLPGSNLTGTRTRRGWRAVRRRSSTRRRSAAGAPTPHSVKSAIRDRNPMGTEEPRPVLQGLDLPALDAASQRSRIAEVVRWARALLHVSRAQREARRQQRSRHGGRAMAT